MNIKLKKLQHKTKKRSLKLWYIIMKPLANLLTYIEDIKYKKLVDQCKTMSDEELIERFAKYIIKEMIRSNNHKKEYIVFSNRGKHNRELDEECIIFNDLRNIWYKCKDKKLQNWRYHSDNAKLYYSLNDPEEQFPAYEKKLNMLLKTQLDKMNVKTEYINIREVGYKTQGDTYDFYGRYLDDIGYEKTLVIHL